MYILATPGASPPSTATASFSAALEPIRLAAYAQVANKSVRRASTVRSTASKLCSPKSLQPLLLSLFLH